MLLGTHPCTSGPRGQVLAYDWTVRRARSRKAHLPTQRRRCEGINAGVQTWPAASREIPMARSSSTASTRPEKIPKPAEAAVTLHVNGVVQSWPSRRGTLLDALRLDLNLTGTKKGCDHGQCGACTVLVDGRRINSCLTLAVMKDGAQVTTIEGLAQAGTLHPLQQAFIEHDAFQCGYCTPGQICSAAGLIAEGRAQHGR